MTYRTILSSSDRHRLAGLSRGHWWALKGMSSVGTLARRTAWGLWLEYRASSGSPRITWECLNLGTLPAELFTDYSWEGLESSYRAFSKYTIRVSLSGLPPGAPRPHSAEASARSWAISGSSLGLRSAGLLFIKTQACVTFPGSLCLWWCW